MPADATGDSKATLYPDNAVNVVQLPCCGKWDGPHCFHKLTVESFTGLLSSVVSNTYYILTRFLQVEIMQDISQESVDLEKSKYDLLDAINVLLTNLLRPTPGCRKSREEAFSLPEQVCRWWVIEKLEVHSSTL